MGKRLLVVMHILVHITPVFSIVVQGPKTVSATPGDYSSACMHLQHSVWSDYLYLVSVLCPKKSEDERMAVRTHWTGD